MRKGKIIFSFFIVFGILFLVSSSNVLSFFIPPDLDYTPSNLKIVSRPDNEYIITNSNSLTLKWKATTNKYTNGYVLKIGSFTYTGSWSSGNFITFTFDPSDNGYTIGSISINMNIKDKEKSKSDSLTVIISADDDGDLVNNIVEQRYTGTDPNQWNEFFTGPTVDVKLHYRANKAKVTFNNLLNSNGEGTIPRRLYHFLQKYVCQLTSDIVRIERTDPIKILQIDTWAWDPLVGVYGTHGFVVKLCILGQINVNYREGSDYIWEKYDYNQGSISAGLTKAVNEGYDVISLAVGTNVPYYTTHLLVEEYGTSIVIGTGNAIDGSFNLTSVSKMPHIISPGAATDIDLNSFMYTSGLYHVGLYYKGLLSKFGEGMDFLVDGNVFGIPLVWTSWSTGKCAGMVVNMLCANQNLDPVSIRDLMRQSCIKNILFETEFGSYPYGNVIDWPDYGWHERYGYGLLMSSYCHSLAVAQLDEPY
jgi:hypothetical protein